MIETIIYAVITVAILWFVASFLIGKILQPGKDDYKLEKEIPESPSDQTKETPKGHSAVKGGQIDRVLMRVGS